MQVRFLRAYHEEIYFVNRVYTAVRSVSDDAHGNTEGFYGTLTSHSLHEVFRAMEVFGSRVVDFGSGKGIPMASALAMGASRVHGFELQQNSANKMIFDAALNRLASKQERNDPSLISRARFELKNIEKVFVS